MARKRRDIVVNSALENSHFGEGMKTRHILLLVAAFMIAIMTYGGIHYYNGLSNPNKRDAQGWIIPTEETVPAASRCEAASNTAFNSCRREYENIWNDGGQNGEDKMQHAKDYDRCHRVENETFNACNLFGR